MSEDKYITWNNITKYANDNILIDGNNVILEFQWFNEQLFHMCSHLNIQYKNELNTELNRKDIINKILLISNNYSFKKCEKCDLLGMFSNIKKTPANYYYNNIGGVLNQKLNIENNQVIFDNTKPLFVLEKKQSIAQLNFKYPRYFTNYLVSKHEKKIRLIDTIIQRERDKLSMKEIEKGTTIYNDIGRIDHSNHSSSLDSIFSLFFYSNLDLFFRKITTTKKISKIDTIIDGRLSLSEHTKIRLEFQKELYKIKAKLESMEIITISDFRKKLRLLFSNNFILNRPFYKNVNYYPEYFLQTFLTIFDFEYSNYTKKTTYLLEDIEDTINYDGVNKKILKIVDFLEKIEDEKNTKIVFLDISPRVFTILNTRNYYVKDYSNILQNTPENLVYCKICNEFLLKGSKLTKLHSKSFHKDNEINLSEIMNYQLDILDSENPYWFILDNNWDYKKVADDWLFYNLKTDEKISSKNAIERNIAQKHDRYVEKYETYDCEYIFYTFNRNLGRKNKNTLIWESNYNDTPITPNKVITDSKNNEYELLAIITNRNDLYQSFFIYNNDWVNYNSHFNTEIQEDYFKTIGTYDDLLLYLSGYVKKYGILYIYRQIVLPTN
jgi:hypothetical protein